MPLYDSCQVKDEMLLYINETFSTGSRNFAPELLGNSPSRIRKYELELQSMGQYIKISFTHKTNDAQHKMKTTTVFTNNKKKNTMLDDKRLI